MKHCALWLLLLCFRTALSGQSAYLPYDEDDYLRIRRLEIVTNEFSPYFHTSLAPISRQSLATWADSFRISGNPISMQDFKWLHYVQADNPEYTLSEAGKRKAFLRYFYPQKSALLYHKDRYLALRVNPILNLQAGSDLRTGDALYQNTRGAEVQGSIAGKVGFYTYLTENQLLAPQYLRTFKNHTGNYPSAGLTKTLDDGGYDFFQARGYITFSPVKDIISLQFGHDRNFIGDGYRSFILSDFGKEYLFLKVNTKVWKFHYQNLFAELVDQGAGGESNQVRKKYIASHFLSLNITRNLNIGLFETIVFDRTDSNGFNRGFEANYLNPVIFYRSVEHGLNSSDNALIGMTAKWNFLRHFSLYGQLVLDEFVIEEYRDNRGWWANKYAAQIGILVIDPLYFVKNMELRVEYNAVRPYTFMHFKITQNYTHYRTPLGHPLGANFSEFLTVLTYRPSPRLSTVLTYMSSLKGYDTDTLNWGGDLSGKDYNDLVMEYGNKIGQGTRARVNLVELRVSYQIAHRVFLEAVYLYRSSSSALPVHNRVDSVLMLGLRMNMARARNLF